MHFHKQNLNEKPGNRYGSILRRGRCWWHFEKTTYGAEWSFGWARLGGKIGLLSGDHTISLALHLLFVSLYWHMENHGRLHEALNALTRRSDQKYSNGREIGLNFYQEYIWIDFWNDPMESRTKQDPWWWHISIDWKRILFGELVYSVRTLRREKVEIPMPEAAYPATVELQEATRGYKRWFKRLSYEAEITPDKPIPFPGKGENSWDCGEDAMFALHCQAKTLDQAIGETVRSVMRDRFLYGGHGWRPKETVKP